MTKILLVTHISPQVVGVGGEHRSYQIWYDLNNLPDVKEVRIFDPRSDYQKGIKSQQPPRIGQLRLPWRLWILPHKLRLIRENPYRLFYETAYSINKFSHKETIANYVKVIQDYRPSICVIQHAACSWMAEINKKFGIVMVACPQNLDAIDHTYVPKNKWYLRTTMFDLVNEITALNSCDQIFFISKVEAAITNGLGYQSNYYPYLPVGEIKTALETIRNRRLIENVEQGLFLVIGTAHHQPIRDGMLWLLKQIEEYGLPSGIRIIFAGAGTEELIDNNRDIPNVEFMGWIAQDVLDRLLTTVQGILLPKFRGFGSVTRLSEMSCAGIPIIASRVSTFAQDMPPYVWEADQDWQSWLTAIKKVMEFNLSENELYDNWYARQPRPLSQLINVMNH